MLSCTLNKRVAHGSADDDGRDLATSDAYQTKSRVLDDANLRPPSNFYRMRLHHALSEVQGTCTEESEPPIRNNIN